jgi:capsular exopolysaccharide synthesis family protein
MIENNLQRKRGRRRSISPSNSLRGYFFALARQVMQWADSEGRVNGGRPVSIGVTSLEHGVGSSTVSFNLACSLASLVRSKTLLIESDFGRPYISRRLGVSKSAGLSEMLLGVAEESETVFSTPINNVSVLGAGMKNDQESFELPYEELASILNESLNEFSYTVFDLPLASDLTACHSIAPHLDGVILTVDSNFIDQRRVARFKKRVESYGVPVIGIVLNKT